MYDSTTQACQKWMQRVDDASCNLRFINQLVLTYLRRQNERSQDLDWAWLDEMHKADALFNAQYHFAIAQRELAANGLTRADFALIK